MEDLMRHRAFEAFCRQRAQMEGEGAEFWLEEAEGLAKLITDATRLNIPTALKDDSKKALRHGSLSSTNLGQARQSLRVW
jgi:hypothetical protein